MGLAARTCPLRTYGGACVSTALSSTSPMRNWRRREMQRILGQWKDIQSDFVDGPRKAVQDADALVAEVMQRLAQTLTSEREQLESQWAGGDDVSTEDLRRCLRLYRAYFERLLAA